MRILQVTTSNQRRGAEVFAHDLSRGLERLGHVVTTVALEGSTDPTALPGVVLGPGRTRPRTGSALVGAMRANDVALAHGGPSLLPVALASAVSGTPFLYRNIGDPEFWGEVPFASLRIGAPLRRAAGVIALYERARAFLVERYRLRPARVTTASNAVDLDGFPRVDDMARRRARAELGVDGDAPVLAYLGALSAEKRPELGVEVAAAMTEARLVIAGDGPLRRAVENEADRLAPHRVTLLGSWDRPDQVLAAADILLVPSRTEGVPGALLEAAATGTPVVATDVGGVGEVIETLGAGVAVGRDGRIDDLLDATRAVLAEPGRYVSDRAVVAEHHGVDAIARRYDAAIRAAVTPPGR